MATFLITENTQIKDILLFKKNHFKEENILKIKQGKDLIKFDKYICKWTQNYPGAIFYHTTLFGIPIIK